MNLSNLEPRTPDYGLENGQFTRPEIMDFHLPTKFRTTAAISLAQTAAGTWVFGYGVKFKQKWESQACRALGEQFDSREGALLAGIIEIVHWLRAHKGNTQPARLALLDKCQVSGVRCQATGSNKDLELSNLEQ